MDAPRRRVVIQRFHERHSNDVRSTTTISAPAKAGNSSAKTAALTESSPEATLMDSHTHSMTNAKSATSGRIVARTAGASGMRRVLWAMR